MFRFPQQQHSYIVYEKKSSIVYVTERTLLLIQTDQRSGSQTVISTSLGRRFFFFSFPFLGYFLKYLPLIRSTAKKLSDLCNFYSRILFFLFKKLSKISNFFFFLLFFAEFEFELVMFTKNIVNISEKIEQAEPVEFYLPYIFIHSNYRKSENI